MFSSEGEHDNGGLRGTMSGGKRKGKRVCTWLNMGDPMVDGVWGYLCPQPVADGLVTISTHYTPYHFPNVYMSNYPHKSISWC